MTINHKLSIDLTRRECPVAIEAVQGDCGRTLTLMLHTNGIPWAIPEDMQVLIRYVRSDGTGSEYDTLSDGGCPWQSDGNFLTVTLAPQVLAEAGEVWLSFLLTRGHVCISTFDIPLHVQEDIHSRTVHPDTVTAFRGTAEDAVAEIGARIMSGRISSVVLLGDSITDGAGGSGYNGSFSAALSTNTSGYCWANAFKKLAESRYGITVQNKGMYGTQMCTQKDAALTFLSKQDFVIWLTGTNDRNSAGSYERDLRRSLDAVREKCAGLLVISSIPATVGDEDSHAVTMQKMDEIVTAVSAGYLPYFSMYRDFTGYCQDHGIALDDCFTDHVHPNDLGHFIMFQLLCKELGLPLDPYTDYSSVGSWWTDSTDGCPCEGTDDVLISNTDTRTPEQCTEGVYLAEHIIPCAIMTDYDSASATTALSGKHISRALLHVYLPGQITFGTVDLTQVGKSSPVYLTSKTVTVEETGVVEIPLHIDVGAHQTLAVHSLSDTGKLGFFLTKGSDPDDDLRVWKSNAFAGFETDAGIHIYGAIYGK